MNNETFDKAQFIKDVQDNVKNLYRKTIKEATQQEIFQAVSFTVKDVIIDEWLATQRSFDKQDPKMVYYMSMEFLMGRALGNNLINLKAYKQVKEALEEMGLNLDVIRHLETVDWVVLQPALWNPSQHWAMQHMAVESVTVTECSNRRSKMVFRLRYRTTG